MLTYDKSRENSHFLLARHINACYTSCFVNLPFTEFMPNWFLEIKFCLRAKALIFEKIAGNVFLFFSR